MTETRSCYETCSTEIIGTINNNLLDILPNVESEFICKEQCGASQDCKYYTYFTEGDANAKLCVLLSFLIEPFQPCENCVTGYGNCQDVQDCGLMYNGETYKSLKFTDPGVMINVTTTKPFLGECQLRVLAIGGGGYGYYEGGAGSGYIQYLNKPLTASSSISLTVGDSSSSMDFYFD